MLKWLYADESRGALGLGILIIRNELDSAVSATAESATLSDGFVVLESRPDGWVLVYLERKRHAPD